MKFTKKTVAIVENPQGPAEMNTLALAGDINGDGYPDIVVSGRHGRMVWLENSANGDMWHEHPVDNVQNMECGGVLQDLTGNGRLDIINGGTSKCDEIYWWENDAANGAWTKRVIAKTGFTQFHDVAVGYVGNDTAKSVVFNNQRGENGTNVCRVAVPDDLSVSPWPGLEIIAKGKGEEFLRNDGGKKLQPEEGLAIGDIDGDGHSEIVSGTHWYKMTSKGWECHKFAQGYITTKVAIGDIDGDGRSEILLAEGDPVVYGKTQGGKLSWFKPGSDIHQLWDEHVLEDFLYDAHTLALGNICGNGHPDILCGEIGKAGPDRQYVDRLPRIMVLENDGKAHFKRHIIDEGTGIHEGVLVDTRNRGVLDIVGKPLHGAERWHVHVYENDFR